MEYQFRRRKINRLDSFFDIAAIKKGGRKRDAQHRVNVIAITYIYRRVGRSKVAILGQSGPLPNLFLRTRLPTTNFPNTFGSISARKTSIPREIGVLTLTLARANRESAWSNEPPCEMSTTSRQHVDPPLARTKQVTAEKFHREPTSLRLRRLYSLLPIRRPPDCRYPNT